MWQKLLRVVSVVCVIFSLLLSGCGREMAQEESPDPEIFVQTMVAQTLTAMVETVPEEEVEEPELVIEPSETPTITEVPTDTPIPTEAFTPTPSIPQVQVGVNTNCRRGPGLIYDILGYLLVGESAEVVGQYAEGDYWVVQNPDRPGECWLWGNYATLEGPIGDLPYFTPPPTPTPSSTPTPVFSWAGAWTTYAIPLGGGSTETITITVTVDGKNFSATGTIGGGTITFSGIISDDNLVVSGTWSAMPITGTFKFSALGANQFQGNGNNGMETFAWCGSRSGAGQPSPCYKE